MLRVNSFRFRPVKRLIRVVHFSERVYKAMRRSSVRSGMFIARASLSLPSPGGATDIYMPLLTELGDLGAPDEL